MPVGARTYPVIQEQTGLSPATYYRYRERLEKHGQLNPIEPPYMEVQGTPPKPKPKKSSEPKPQQPGEPSDNDGECGDDSE